MISHPSATDAFITLLPARYKNRLGSDLVKEFVYFQQKATETRCQKVHLMSVSAGSFYCSGLLSLAARFRQFPNINLCSQCAQSTDFVLALLRSYLVLSFGPFSGCKTQHLAASTPDSCHREFRQTQNSLFLHYFSVLSALLLCRLQLTPENITSEYMFP